MRLVEFHKLCLGCLTPGHSRAARSCPYKEERVDVCKKSACKGGHHYLLHMERVQAKARQRGPPDERSAAVSEPTQVEEQRSAVQLVAQWVDTQGGEPCLVFWDTGSQVTLTMHKAAWAMRLQAIPGSPLNLVAIGDDHR
jgi:hypothetical protein